MKAGEPVKKLDCCLTIVLLALVMVSLAVLYLLQGRPAGENLTVEIYKNGRLYRSVPLDETSAGEIKISDSEGHYNLVEFRDGKVRIKEADCPNQLCVKTGWLSKPGRISVCAPNKLKVIVKGQSEGTDQVDTITY
ncbi:MAG TPA: NusG domain II-containing protein [Bacillota bacterium]|jgi:hypothetical protein|nr:NusG domain II-containing protein [Peptococcaceae bacterium MAG4]HQD76956.1 NusG domain II-containing protein [Bacillota bacterium]HUM59446.1 NusG domain II-containing protein [Bacillota bacterium]